jgi:hypothetical protein
MEIFGDRPRCANNNLAALRDAPFEPRVKVFLRACREALSSRLEPPAVAKVRDPSGPTSAEEKPNEMDRRRR